MQCFGKDNYLALRTIRPFHQHSTINGRQTVKRTIIICLLLLLLGSINTNAFADTLYLNNGDKITGKIISSDDVNITIATEYAGDIKLKWASVAYFESQQPVTIKLKDKSTVIGTALPSVPGKLSLKPDQQTNPVTINVDQIVAVNPPNPDNFPLSGQVNIGGMKHSGNTNNQTLHADVELQARGENNRTTIGAIYNQGANNGNENVNNSRVYLSYDYFITDNWYAYANTDFSTDKFQDLNYRASVSGGLGHQFWDDEVKYLSFESGPVYNYENYNVVKDRSFIAGRWALDFRYWLINDRMQFFHDHEGILNFEDLADVLVRSHTGIRIPVIGNFNFKFQFDVDHDSLPADNKKKSDFRYIVGVGYAF